MRIFAIIFIVFGFAFHPNLAQTPEQVVIATARKLEEEPFDRKNLKMRKKSLKWIYTKNKFHLTCGISGHYLPTSYKFRSDLFAIFIIGTVAFYLENPDKPEIEEAAKN